MIDSDILICKLQVAIWRDARRKRVVIAFRGTEQVGIYLYHLNIMWLIFLLSFLLSVFHVVRQSGKICRLI